MDNNYKSYEEIMKELARLEERIQDKINKVDKYVSNLNPEEKAMWDDLRSQGKNVDEAFYEMEEYKQLMNEINQFQESLNNTSNTNNRRNLKRGQGTYRVKPKEIGRAHV